MLDVTNCPKIQDENRGVNEKLWINVNGKPALFKKTQVREDGTHTNAHYSESIVSDICKKINSDCASVDIAQRGSDIGCVSYSFLKEGEELVDLVALIQNIRIGFDSKSMVVPDTNEKYCIPLILEALEEECSSKEEYDNLRKDFLKSCIIDSIIEHYDRNPSNISVIRNKDGVKLSPMFDNGTSLGVAIPEQAVKENIDREEWMQELRENNKSKIGVEGEKYSNYDKLLEYILSNYYSDVKDFLDVIQEELTLENIQEILSDEKYGELSEIHKQLIAKKINLNRTNLLEQKKNYELKNEIEEIMGKENSSEILLKMMKEGTLKEKIPEIEKCENCPQRNPYHIYNVDEYMFKCIENINNYEEIAKDAGFDLKLTDKDKRNVQWAIMFNEMGKPETREEEKQEDGTIRDTFRNYSKRGQEIASQKMEELNFYKTEIETIKTLIASHDKRSLDSDSAIKKLVDSVGEKNLDLYFAMKLAETNAKNPELREETIGNLKTLKTRIEEIQKTDNRNLIKSLPQNGKKLMGLGVKGQQVGMLQQALANHVREDERMYTYYKARGHLEKFRKELTQYATSEAKEIKRREKAKKLEQSMQKSQSLDEEILKEESKKDKHK